jgi:hypothetical protein
MNEKYRLTNHVDEIEIMRYVIKSMRQEHRSQKEIDTYLVNAQKFDFNNLLRVSLIKLDELNNGWIDKDGL